jgi:uncharacterized repeat protein (TIGR01451 family)
LEVTGGRIAPAISPPRPLRAAHPELLRLEVRALLSVNVLQNFSDINHNQTSCGCTPPDTMLAVGPTTVLGAVNTALVLKDKSGNTLAGPEEFGTFFSSIVRPGDLFSDPYVIYDDQANVYYAGILEFPSSGTTGYFDFAVSNSSTPTGFTVGTGSGSWTVFPRITSVNEGGTQFPDFPKMGWNNDAVFVSFNEFAGGSTFTDNLVFAISKSSILAHGSLTTFQKDVSTNLDRRILIPSRMHGSTPGTEYFVQMNSEGSVHGSVNVVAETGYLTSSPSFTTTTISVNPFQNSPGVPGLTTQIDDRVLSADWLNNDLVASMDVGVGGLNLARWYEFSTSGTPALVPGQQEDISAGSGVSTSYPSVAIDPNGDIGMTYIQSSNTQPYSMYVTGRLASDPAGTMQTPVEIAAGVQPVPSALRGGDYSATEYDPTSTSQFWSANEYNFDKSGSNFDWGTQIANYTLGTSPVADLSLTNTGPPTATEGDNNLTYTLVVANGGPNDAPSTVLTDTLDPHMAFVSATTSQGTFTQSGGVVTFSLGTVPNGKTATATVTVQATEDGTLTDTGTVSSSDSDPTPADNTKSASTSVSEPAINVSPPIVVTGRKFVNITVATFTHANGVEPPSAFSATINWGDGKTSSGTITLSGTTYTVKGSHSYLHSGTYTVTTTVQETGSTPKFAGPLPEPAADGDRTSSLVRLSASGAQIVDPGFGVAFSQRPLLAFSARQASVPAVSSLTPRSSVVAQRTGTIMPLAPGAASGLPGLADARSSPANPVVTSGIAALDLDLSLPVPQVLETQGSGLWPAIGRPRHAWSK